MGVMRRTTTREDGFLLIEVMVSAVVLLVLAMATLQIIDRAGKQAGTDRSRSVATTLAQADQDRIRALKPAALYNFGRSVQTKTVDGVSYEITTDVALTRDTTATGGTTVCSAGGTTKADYFRILSTVKWPNMNATRPVALATILSPGVTDPTKGSLTVKLANEAGAGVSGATVSTGSLSATTDADGCASFSNLTPGTYAVTWAKVGYVDKSAPSKAIGGKSATVSANQNASLSDSYDLGATVPVDFQGTDNGAATWKTFTLASPANLYSVPITPTSAPYSVAGLYPFSAGYNVYAGNCAANEPSQYVSGYYAMATGSSVVPLPGENPTAQKTAYLRPVTVPVVKVSGGTTLPYSYRITPDNSASKMPGCSEGIATTAAAAGAAINTDAPYGYYNLCVQATIAGTTYSETQKIDTRPAATWAATKLPVTTATVPDVTTADPKASC
jgi:Tfp pilus assembly protein PilV